MNTNFKSCPKCGHSANDNAAVCAYCGAVVSAEEPSLQTGKKASVEVTPHSEQTPLMQPDVTHPDITKTEAPENSGTTVAEWREPEDSDSPPAATSAEQTSEPINEPAAIKTEHESVVEISGSQSKNLRKPVGQPPSSDRSPCTRDYPRSRGGT